MGGLSAYAWRSLRARPLRSLLTVLGIALGVAVVFAALATNAGIEAAADGIVAQLVGRSELRVEALSERGLGPTTVEAIATTPGVDVVAPSLERRTYLGADPNHAIGPDAPPVTVLGVDPPADGRINVRTLMAGAPLADRAEPSVLVSETMARQTGLAVGDRISLNGLDAPRPVRIVGILAGDGPPIGRAGRTLIMPIGQALALFGTDSVTRVDLGLAPGASADAVAVELERRLVAEPYVLSPPADLAASLRSSTGEFRATTALLAAIALFGGAFLIFNTLSMTVGERVREVGLLRAAGATRRQVNGLVLLQAIILGLAGGALGVLLGAGLAALIAAYVRATGLAPIEPPQLPLEPVLLAVGTGTLVTVAAALEPAVRAGRIAPIEALRPTLGNDPLGRARLRWLVVVFVVVAAVGLVLWPAGASASGTARWLAVYGSLLVATLLTPILLDPLGRLAGLPFRLIAPAAARLTRGSLIRDRSRTTLTVGSLTVGLAMIVALGGVAQDARRAATAWIASVVPGDVVVTAIRPVAPDEQIAEQLASIDGVARVSPLATFETAFRGVRMDAAAVVGADLLADGRLSFVEGDRTAALNALDAGGATVLPQSVARRLALRVGDDMTFPVGGSRTVTLRVVGIVERAIPGRTTETVLVGWSDATEGFGVQGADAFAVRYAPGRAAAAGPALEETARGLALEPTSLDRIAGVVDAALTRIFGLFDALALVAVIVAALGIVNTLTMNVYERVREIGVLRATGMTRGQVWRMIVVEAGILGVVGAILGCLTGVVAGQMMIGLAGGGALRLPFEPDWPTILLTAVFGIAVAMLAAVWPARVASRLSIVRAVQFE